MPSRIDGGRAFFPIGLGLLKKALIADFLAENLVNRVFDTPNLYSGAEALLAVYAYSLQIYFDFSGYTDIARGTAMLLGIQLPINFDRPYLSANLNEFWRRWHLSFSNWLRDYLYFSLPGKRAKVLPYANLAITMLLGGLTWPFAVWGLLHGTALAGTRWYQVRRGAGLWRRSALITSSASLGFSSARRTSPMRGKFWAGSGRLRQDWKTLRRCWRGRCCWALPPCSSARPGTRVRCDGWFRGRAFLCACRGAGGATIQFLGGHGSVPFVYSRF